MIVKQPKELLELLIRALRGENSPPLDIGIVLCKTAMRLFFVEENNGELHYKINVIRRVCMSLEDAEEEIVKSISVRVSLTSDETLMYSSLVSFVLQAIPALIVEQEGPKHKIDLDINNASIYILSRKES